MTIEQLKEEVKQMNPPESREFTLDQPIGDLFATSLTFELAILGIACIVHATVGGNSVKITRNR